MMKLYLRDLKKDLKKPYFISLVMSFCLIYWLKSPNWYLGSWVFFFPNMIYFFLILSTFPFFYNYSFNFKALFSQKCVLKPREEINLTIRKGELWLKEKKMLSMTLPNFWPAFISSKKKEHHWSTTL